MFGVVQMFVSLKSDSKQVVDAVFCKKWISHIFCPWRTSSSTSMLCLIRKGFSQTWPLLIFKFSMQHHKKLNWSSLYFGLPYVYVSSAARRTFNFFHEQKWTKHATLNCSVAFLWPNVISSSLLTRYKCCYFSKMDATNIFIVS